MFEIRSQFFAYPKYFGIFPYKMERVSTFPTGNKDPKRLSTIIITGSRKEKVLPHLELESTMKLSTIEEGGFATLAKILLVIWYLKSLFVLVQIFRCVLLVDETISSTAALDLLC